MTAEPSAQRIGPYAVESLIGQGGMGVVYRVRDPQVDRMLALKLIRALRVNSVGFQRFMREAETLARVRHRNVVRVHELGRCERGPYLVTEFVEGEPLDAALAHRALSPTEAATIARDLADAVAAVHAQGVLHRDLKPQNVILRAESGEPVLLDFGLARDTTADSLTETGQLIGTPAYMAPEQVGGKGEVPLTEAVDVHGLGALLYTLLTRRGPYEGESGYILMANILRAEPTWPRDLDPGVPTALDAVCRRALAKAPGDRYPSAAAMRDDLDRFLGGETTKASGGPSRVKAWLAAGALVVAVGVSGIVGLTRPEPSAPAPPVEPEAPKAVVSAPTPESPGREPLWALVPGETLRMEWHYIETDANYRFFFAATVRADVKQGPEPTERELVMRFDDTRGSFEALSVVFDDSTAYDSRRHDPNHPLAPLRSVVNVPFSCTIDTITGRVTMVRGAEGLLEAVCMGLDGERRKRTRGQFQGAFNTALIEAGFDALLHMVDTPDRRLSWSPGRRRGERLEFFVANSDPRRLVIPPASKFYKPATDHLFVFEGEVAFGRSGLLSSRIRQTLVSGTPPEQSKQSLSSGALVSDIVWKLTALSPGR